MNHADHVALIRDGVPSGPGVWADLGSGHGAFTLALADLLGPQGVIYSVDRDGGALARQRAAMAARFPDRTVTYLTADFSGSLDLPSLDGVVMANSLHFCREQIGVLREVAAMLKPGGRLVIVEYDAERGNPWVPHPICAARWLGLALEAGFVQPRILSRHEGRFMNGMYSGIALKQ